MAVNTFNSHLDELGNRLLELRVIIDKLDGLLLRHNNNAYSSLVSGDYDGRLVTKLEYDNAMTSINALLNTWLPAGNGTNIDSYLYEVP